MIRCGGFFFSEDREKVRAAARSAERMAASGTTWKTVRGETLGVDGGDLVALSYGGDGLPVVHGWPGEGPDAGERTTLSLTDEGLSASRDHCGTRPLYVGASGKWVASDHRFLREDSMELLPPGAALSVTNGRRVVNRPGPAGFEGTFEEAAARLADTVRASVEARVDGLRRVAVAFSGGLDSSMLAHCAAARSKVVACSASAEGSVDRRSARDAASVAGLEFVEARVDGKILKDELASLDLPFEPSPMDKSLWCIYSVTARLASESGAEAIILGQLADELFGGYSKYEVALRRGGESSARDLMAADVASCGMRGFVRDEAACRRWCEPRFPFAEKEVAVLGECLPVSFKIRDGVRKAVLREAASMLGLPKEVAEKPKKAAQYSSGVLKLLG